MSKQELHELADFLRRHLKGDPLSEEVARRLTALRREMKVLVWEMHHVKTIEEMARTLRA
ncbi:MAG: hypothetical protein COU10_02560 [Candidatus Harrisonbacteria bacterium CG10_big_fil_rev_8_21_14_0_10_45_28]|uniref:Uncharacterized protein n=1 Tax=Candidatus Harrisonbacteria bacterium CG10_big_fil_rev_8_21_14_0_10_45_28 TaxID=1974586 RepID=A0A2H0UN42_9BACT|nr:MAG: hypothetical protein COU10_02560 [Candidatus Harrisonbacteria bacterium CG10_big_fil_rev_8_21_14_0_10_45_28]